MYVQGLQYHRNSMYVCMTVTSMHITVMPVRV